MFKDFLSVHYNSRVFHAEHNTQSANVGKRSSLRTRFGSVLSASEKYQIPIECVDYFFFNCKKQPKKSNLTIDTVLDGLL